jgi:molybdenum cofactor synthesis domain-containing protein
MSLGHPVRNISGPSSSVAACIIASEVLNGKTLDTNSNYLAKKCFSVGLTLKHIRVIPDQRDVIVHTVKELSREYQLVVTSGGIGPTHDDLTYECISVAFNRPLAEHSPTVDRMKSMIAGLEDRERLNEGQKRMAMLPDPDEVVFTPGLWVPLVRVGNVLVLPGVPRLFHQMCDHWFDAKLKDTDLVCRKLVRRLVRTNWKESMIAGKLTAIQAGLREADIEIGSYPKLLDDGTSHVIISVLGPEDATPLIDEAVRGVIESFDGFEVKMG